jgi:hypothetical protein
MVVRAISGPAFAAVLSMCLGLCASGFPRRTDQDPNQPIVLAPGDSLRIPDTSLVLTFETVVEDSRCPAGARCVWEGDAAVRIRIDAPHERPSTYTLHTNERLGRALVHGQVRVELAAVAPYPAADRKVRPEEYRVTVQIHRK